MHRFIFMLGILLANLLCAQNEWSFLNSSRIGATQFIKDHPNSNGKNTIIFIMDTGVDPLVSGLIKTPDGSSKVIDVFDFSGEGDVYLELAEKSLENDEYILETSGGYRLYGYNLVHDQPFDSIYFIGVLDEQRFLNSKVMDINANGKTNDRFGVVLFQKSIDEWIAYVDLDADGNISDEKPQKDYSIDKKVLQFRGYDKKYDFLPLNIAMKIYPDEQKVNFHFDAHGHGTHVAGIAAGYKINNIATLNGIAPGAKIISLKIGDTHNSGAGTVTGSMVSAYDYVAEFANNYDGTAIINMSYGISSENEGHSDIEDYLEDFITDNQNVVVCLSAGNEGPGISTIGLPAAAPSAISVGALNTVDNARDIYGGNIFSDKIFVFSSSGGEVNKPDVIAPGAASSTIPAFSSLENKWGTSMASPQVAGAIALMISAIKIENPTKKIAAFSICQALKNSAVPLNNYLPVEQGNGVVNIPGAYDLLLKYVQREEIISGYEVSTINPFYEDGYGTTVFWRQGTYLPTKDDKQTIYINAKFNKNSTEEELNNFYRAFTLSTNADWLKIVQESVYVKGTSPAKIKIYCDEKMLQKPGIYSTYIYAYEKSGLFSSKRDENKQFQILCSVIIPNTIDTNIKTSFIKNKIKLKPGEIYREFILVPQSSSGLSMRVKQNNNDYANLRVYTFNQTGHERAKTLFLNSKKSGEVYSHIGTEDLTPGIWEFVFYAPFTNPETSFFNYEISFSGLEIMEKKITHLSIRNGENPSGFFNATNKFGKILKAKISGRILGVQRRLKLNEQVESYDHNFNVGDLYKSVIFEITLPQNTFNKLTDFTINIKNSSGKVLKTTSIKEKKAKVIFSPPASDDYYLEMIPGFAFEGQTWSAEVKESFNYFKTLTIANQNFNFYPFSQKKVFFSLNGQIDVAPNSYYIYGELWIDSQDKNKIRTIVPVEISSGLY